jgi:hypothetical protein
MRCRPTRRTRAAVVAAALLGCGLLAGCGPEATDGTAAAAEPTASAEPTAPAVPELSPAEWKALAYEPAGCESRDAWVSRGLPATAWDGWPIVTHAGDLTGDSRTGVVVQVVCPHATSTWPQVLVAFEVVNQTPELLAALHTDLFFPEADVTLDEGTLTLDGPTIAEDDPFCCPSHWGQVTYEWTDGGFVATEQVEALTTQPWSVERLSNGEHAGIIRAVTDDRVYVDMIEWFRGEDAQRACAEDGGEAGLDDWCINTYARNTGDLVVELPVADHAGARYWDDGAGREVIAQHVSELAGTGAVATRSDSWTYWSFLVRDGEVTAMKRI